ncbi:MAG: hypothetical protein ABIF77_02425, partial [bacterium]
MATIEQMMYGLNPASAQPGRSIQASSPGMSRECAAEIVRFCEGWGGQPGGVGSRPALLSFPLQTTMPAYPGRLFAIIRVICSSGQAIETDLAGRQSNGPATAWAGSRDLLPQHGELQFHAVVLTESTFTAFGLNPFAVALEGIFQETWAPGLILSKRELQPTSLAPLVTPLPSEADAELIEEALQQILAKGKLVLPLTRSDEQSDRFLALLLAAIPISLKRVLKFASFTVSDVNEYTLAALYRDGNSYTGWRRVLMATVGLPLPVQWDEYVSSVKNSLMLGDLLGVERLSRQALGEIVPSGERLVDRKPNFLSATVSPPVLAKPKPVRRSGLLAPAPVASAATVPVTSQAKIPYASAATIPNTWASNRATVRRMRRRRRTSNSGRAWLLGFSALVIALIVYWFEGDRWDWLPWHPGGDTTVKGPESNTTLLGVIDVGTLYDTELQAMQSGGRSPRRPAAEKAAEKALASLKISAAEDLGQQGRLFIDLVDQGIQQPERPGREAERLQALNQRGVVLEQELRRLI